MPPIIVLASNNVGKISEITSLLQSCSITVKPQSDLGVPEIVETGYSFIENALIKARHAARVTGLPVIADDSGLVVDALNGKPGVRSARYAGFGASAAENLAKLLEDLTGVMEGAREAYFHCTMVYLRHAYDPVPLISSGQWRGRLLLSPRGQHGFGYDPIFYIPELRASAAELSLADKNRFSHRGQALQALCQQLPLELSAQALVGTP